MPKKTVKTKKTAKKATKKTVTKKTAAKKTKKVVTKPAVAAPEAAVVPQVTNAVVMTPVKTEAQTIWDEIKDLPIQMFGLPNQVVAMHCTFVPIEPSQLYVVIRSTATLPSLEVAIAPKFVVELADKYVIVKRAPQKV